MVAGVGSSPRWLSLTLSLPIDPCCVVYQEVKSNSPLLRYELDFLSCGRSDSLGLLRPSHKKLYSFHPDFLGFLLFEPCSHAVRSWDFHMEREQCWPDASRFNHTSPDIAHVSERAIVDIPVPADTTWRRTKTPDTFSHSSCPCHLHPFEPTQLKPHTLGSKDKPSPLGPAQTSHLLNHERNKMVLLCR